MCCHWLIYLRISIWFTLRGAPRKVCCLTMNMLSNLILMRRVAEDHKDHTPCVRKFRGPGVQLGKENSDSLSLHLSTVPPPCPGFFSFPTFRFSLPFHSCFCSHPSLLFLSKPSHRDCLGIQVCTVGWLLKEKVGSSTGAHKVIHKLSVSN